MLILAAAPCCSHAATRAVEPHRLTMFETSEHILIPYGLSLRYETHVEPAHAASLTLTPNFHLTYGQIIALGGDYYADPKQPVCSLPPEQRGKKFEQNFASLVSSGQEVANILRVAKRFEFDPVAAAIKNRQIPSGVFVKNASQGWGLLSDVDRAYDRATGGVDGGDFGRYVNIAKTNFDHFGTDAVACYLAGHVLAQQMARMAGRMPPGDQRGLELNRAYAVNAFADHFLTDLFAAGHMRTPRRALYALGGGDEVKSGFASLLAQRMHDEDNKFGLWVQNRVGDRWVAYGDKRYRDGVNAGNRKVLKKAIQRSMDEVWEAFSTARVRDNDSEVLGYIPELVWEIDKEPTASKHRDDRRNWAPLFWRNPSDGNVWRREGLFNPADRTFGEYSQTNPLKWGVWGTYSQIKLAGAPPSMMPDDEYRRAGYPLRPNEAGPSGEVGWPAGPTAVVGSLRPMTGITGPDVRDIQWVVDGAPEPTN